MSKKKKKDKESQDLDKLVSKKIKEMGVSASIDKPYCHICERDGHLTSACWYNPRYRGLILERIQKQRQDA